MEIHKIVTNSAPEKVRKADENSVEISTSTVEDILTVAFDEDPYEFYGLDVETSQIGSHKKTVAEGRGNVSVNADQILEEFTYEINVSHSDEYEYENVEVLVDFD
jgi:hypothetical protein